jgi:YidC/Oxa1 family membrane protein insertase
LNRKLLFILTLFSVLSLGFARVSFEIRDFSTTDLRNPDLLSQTCAADNATSFWCGEEDGELKLVTAKGVDYIFNEAGEVLAVYAKQQRGQDFRGAYALDNGRNLIPHTSAVPGGAVLVGGEYTEPQNVEGTWTETTYADAPALEGTFSYRVGDLNVEKTLLVSAVRNSIGVSLSVSRTGAGQGQTLVQYVYPGIAKQAQPVIKLGQGESFTLNPPQQEVANPTYISLQANNRNMGVALVLRPNPNVEGSSGDDLFAAPVSGTQIALGKRLGAGADASVTMELQAYGGPNEMVHFLQEDYLELPGLFNPNILGRLSLGIIIVLQFIHGLVGSWGLSIILLTLLFRLLVWPLIATQMNSMAGMQKIQPKLQELQQKYKNDREKLTQETMKMYQEAGVNPAGGCLPALIQMPIFIVLWRVFVNFEFNEGFLWIPDLGLNDPFYLLPILYIGIMVLQVFISSKGNRQTLQQQLLISGVFVFFAFSFPAGVTLYLITSMLVQVLQQWLIMRRLDVAPAAAGIATGSAAKSAKPEKPALPAAQKPSNKGANKPSSKSSTSKSGAKPGKAKAK